MDWHFDDSEHRARYRLCAIGFALSALGLALMSLDTAFHIGYVFSPQQDILQLLEGPFWKWGIGSTVTWTTVIGPYLLLGRWTEPHWRQKASLLLTLNVLDVGFWLLRHGKDFGLWPNDVGHEWLRLQLVYGSSWIQFGLFASLADDVTAHLGTKPGPDGPSRTRSFAVVGFLFWSIAFLQQTNWSRWPLVPRRSLMGFMLQIILMILRMLASFQAAALCLLASRGCSQMARALRTEAGEHHALEALKSRSEAMPDDFWSSHRPDPWA